LRHPTIDSPKSPSRPLKGPQSRLYSHSHSRRALKGGVRCPHNPLPETDHRCYVPRQLARAVALVSRACGSPIRPWHRRRLHARQERAEPARGDTTTNTSLLNTFGVLLSPRLLSFGYWSPSPPRCREFQPLGPQSLSCPGLRPYSTDRPHLHCDVGSGREANGPGLLVSTTDTLLVPASLHFGRWRCCRNADAV